MHFSSCDFRDTGLSVVCVRLFIWECDVYYTCSISKRQVKCCILTSFLKWLRYLEVIWFSLSLLKLHSRKCIYSKIQWQVLVLFLGRNNGLEGNSNSVMEICSFVKMSVQDGKNGLEPAFYGDVYDIIYICGCKWIMDDSESEFVSIEEERLTYSWLSLVVSNICPDLQSFGVYKISVELKGSVWGEER